MCQNYLLALTFSTYLEQNTGHFRGNYFAEIGMTIDKTCVLQPFLELQDSPNNKPVAYTLTGKANCSIILQVTKVPK